MSRSRPAGVDWPGQNADTSVVPHGAPLLDGGQIQAALRDASWFDRPNVRTDKQVHIVVWSRQLGEAAACHPTRIILDVDGLVRDAAKIPDVARCRRGGCARLFAKADQQDGDVR